MCTPIAYPHEDFDDPDARPRPWGAFHSTPRPHTTISPTGSTAFYDADIEVIRYMVLGRRTLDALQGWTTTGTPGNASMSRPMTTEDFEALADSGLDHFRGGNESDSGDSSLGDEGEAFLSKYVTNSAVTLQAHTRALLTRRRLRRVNVSSVILQAHVRAALARLWRRRATSSILRLQAGARSQLARSYMRQVAASAAQPAQTLIANSEVSTPVQP